jgi:rsbT co-antagonist protein RsbR
MNPRGASPIGEISEQELVRRKDFLEFGDADVSNLAEINELAQRYADAVIEDFYKHLLSFEETRSFFHDPHVLQRVKNAQQEYFLRLTQGKYDLAYVENRLGIGAIHERIDLPIKSYLGMYNFYLRAVSNRLSEAYQDQPERGRVTFLSLMKLTFLDIGLASIRTSTRASARSANSRKPSRNCQLPSCPSAKGCFSCRSSD